MSGAGGIKVEGLVVEVLSSKTYRVELPNGHRLLGFVAGRAKPEAPGLKPGDKVRLEMSLYDLSEGRILVN